MRQIVPSIRAAPGDPVPVGSVEACHVSGRVKQQKPTEEGGVIDCAAAIGTK